MRRKGRYRDRDCETKEEDLTTPQDEKLRHSLNYDNTAVDLRAHPRREYKQETAERAKRTTKEGQ